MLFKRIIAPGTFLVSLLRLAQVQERVEGIACSYNIGPKGRQRRKRNGIFFLGLGFLIEIGLVATRRRRAWRLALFIPFVFGTSGIFQALDKTWVGLAARGSRNMDNGVEKIEDAEELRQIRRQALKVNLKSVSSAALLTGQSLLLP